MMNKFIIDHLNILKKKFLNPELELRILLNKSSFKKKEIILSNLKLEDIDIIKFNNSFERRNKNEPISKIFKSKSFWKYDFFVNSDVLDPRPETELIIEKILEYFPDKSKELKILDMFTGSGCIAISLAKEFINSKICATDISSKAVHVAKINAINLNCIQNINFVNCDLLNKISEYDIVISNPPYLSKVEYEHASIEIKNYEPKIALVAANDGYEFYFRISEMLANILHKESFAFVEIGSTQAIKTQQIFRLNNINVLHVAKDLQGLDRVLILNKS